MTEHEALRGTVFDEDLTLTLREVCEVCGVEEVRVVDMVREGIADPLDPQAGTWTFSGVAVTRIRTAYRLQEDLHVNLAGAALALDLLEQIERLR